MDNYVERLQSLEKKSKDNELEEARELEKKANLLKAREKHIVSLKELGVSFDDLEEKIAELKIEMEEDLCRSEKELA